MSLHTVRRLACVALALVATAWIPFADPRPSTQRTPSVDRRTDGLPPAVVLAPDRKQAADDLVARVPEARIHYDRVAGAPSWISSRIGFLSAPAELFSLQGQV